MTTLATIAQTCTAQCRIDSPLGPLLLARTAKGLAGVWFDGQQHHPQVLSAPQCASDELLLRTRRQLARYFDGEAVIFDIPLDLYGTAFQRGVWQALLHIERGATSRYGEIARTVGAPTAARAVGAAVGRNPVSIIVPCHRVLGTGGALTGYAGGLERKVGLLELERARPGPASAAPAMALTWAREAAAA
jgi:methylated-DNA-[protein]-cysteine S-methyltransferase